MENRSVNINFRKSQADETAEKYSIDPSDSIFLIKLELELTVGPKSGRVSALIYFANLN